MKSVPYIPSHAPFTTEQRAWLNGYLAGLFADANAGEMAGAQVATAAPAPKEPLLILYGSQTGSAEGLAKRLAKEAEQKSFAARVLEMNAFASADLAAEKRVVIVTSTWGDGDPPDNAVAFWNHLNSEQAPRLDHLAYSVLALGDRNYAEFCGAGKKFDARLEQLGARRIHPRADCDTDYEAAAKEWSEGLWQALSQLSVVSSPSLVAAGNGALETVVSADAPLTTDHGRRTTGQPLIYSRKTPFPARLIANRVLNAPGSEKETRHFEISLAGSGLEYEPGDALGVMPANCPSLVEEILQALGCDGEEAVKDADGAETSLRHALLHSYVITQPAPSLLKAVAECAGDTALKRLLEPVHKAELDQFLDGREIIDVLLACPLAKFTPHEFIALLRKLQPRLYSISSSPKAHPGEVHLTTAVVRYESHGRSRKGVCSTFLADRVELDKPGVPVFVQVSKSFRLPADGDTPIIMVGPGTGIAPFRAFLEERRATAAKGKNWLFFGDQRQECDFLYRAEMEAMQTRGVLTRLDTAFSRDQEEKIYVQQRMLEHAAELWAWLEDGAHFYVCGDARRMAKDVDAALHEIVQQAGGRTPEAAADYVKQLKANQRYQRDVY